MSFDIVLFFDRFFKGIKRRYNNTVFRHSIKVADKTQRPLIGDIYLINKNIVIGKNVNIYPGVMFWGDGPIVIGNNVDIGKDTILYASSRGGISIGDGSQIAAQCYIIDMDHNTNLGTEIRIQENLCDEIIIGKDVWIGANATILRGSKIHDGAVIGAKGLVKGEVRSNTINVGIPIKEIGYRKKQQKSIPNRNQIKNEGYQI